MCLDHGAAHAVLTVDADQPAAGEHRAVHQHPPGEPKRRVRLRVRIAADHSDCGATGFAQRQHRRPADQLGADDHRAGADLRVVQMHEVLQLAGGVDPVGPVAGDQPGGPWPLPRTGGQDHRVGGDGPDPARRGDLQRAFTGPAGDHRLGLQHRAGIRAPSR